MLIAAVAVYCTVIVTNSIVAAVVINSVVFIRVIIVSTVVAVKQPLSIV